MSLFTPLDIHTAGVGDYRLNRYRIHFDIPQERLDPTYQKLVGAPYDGLRLDQLGQLLHDRFALFINTDNIVHMKPQSRQWNNHDTLAFTLSAGPFGMVHMGLDLAAPDLHADWVGVQWIDPKIGFTVQTLRRNFLEATDYALIGVAGANHARDEIFVQHSPVTPQWAKHLSDATDQLTHDGAMANMQHVLAGRRSWRIGKAETFEPGAWTHSPHTYTLETAAIERLSDPFFQSLSQASLNSTTGWSIPLIGNWKLAGDFDEALKTVWVTYMNSFCRIMRFNVHRAQTLTHYDQDVSWLQEDFQTRSACEASKQFGLITGLFREVYP